jgi:hypothetical protein
MQLVECQWQFFTISKLHGFFIIQLTENTINYANKKRNSKDILQIFCHEIVDAARLNSFAQLKTKNQTFISIEAEFRLKVERKILEFCFRQHNNYVSKEYCQEIGILISIYEMTPLRVKGTRNHEKNRHSEHRIPLCDCLSPISTSCNYNLYQCERFFGTDDQRALFF